MRECHSVIPNFFKFLDGASHCNSNNIPLIYRFSRKVEPWSRTNFSISMGLLNMAPAWTWLHCTINDINIAEQKQTIHYLFIPQMHVYGNCNVNPLMPIGSPVTHVNWNWPDQFQLFWNCYGRQRVKKWSSANDKIQKVIRVYIVFVSSMDHLDSSSEVLPLEMYAYSHVSSKVNWVNVHFLKYG